MHNNAQRGYTLDELMVIVAISLIFVSIVAGAMLNNMGATERRALTSAEHFLLENNIQVKRMTCAGDSDGDGYSTCSVVTASGEKIMLQCPVDYFDVNWFGAKQCKELYYNVNMEGQQ